MSKMKFKDFINKFKTDDAKNATHLSLKGGKYNIDEKNIYNFFKCYYENYKTEKLYIVEKINKDNFKLFYDLDSKDIILDDDLVFEFIKDVKKIFENLKVNVNLTYILHKSDTRYHLIYPELTIDNKIVYYINTKLCELNNIYKKIIDNSVYNTGLRLIGSYKTNSNKVYQIYDIQNKEYSNLTFNLLLKSSIINFDNIEKLQLNIDLDIIYNNNTNIDLKKNEIKNETLKLTNVKNYTNNILYENLKNLVIDIKTENNIEFILIKERHCPFYNCEHKRKQYYLYLEYNKLTYNCKLRCYNSECKGKSIKVKTKMDVFLTNNINLIKKSINGGHFSIAKLISIIYPNKYRIDNLKHKTWYEFDGTRWIAQSCGLYIMLSEELPKYYLKYLNLIVSDGTDENEKDENENDKKRIYTLIKNLETTAFKKNILEELANIYYNIDPDFYNKLDSNPMLIGFNNGIYDLSKFEFREGKYDDYLTLTTGYDYIEYTNDDPKINEIMTFLSQIITDNDIKQYLLLVLGKSLSGLLDDKFFVWTGITGANGKSTLINFLEMALGGYSTSIDISLLTQKRTASSNATPDLVRLRGKRFFSLQEPEHNDVLRTGLLKQLTGGDNIIARELFKSPITFKLQGTMVLCCNDLPSIASNDGGTWRRLRVIEFNSRFCDNPKKFNEFKIVPNIKDKLKSWKSCFMFILITYYKKYVNEYNYIINEPSEVIDSTNKYKHDNDKFSDFINECLVESTEFTPQKEIYTTFRIWWDSNYPSYKIPEIKELKRALVSSFGREKILEISSLKTNGFNLSIKSNLLHNDNESYY